MKNRDLKSLIRRAAEREMPNVIDRIDLTTIEIVPPARKAARIWKWERAVQFAVVFLFFGFTSILIYDLLTPETQPDPMALETEAELYGFPIVSAASFLSSMEPADLSMVPLAMTLEAEEPLITDQIDGLTAYLDIMESLLGTEEDIGFSALASDREEYQYRLSYSSLDLLGEVVAYDIYYNQSLSSEIANRSDITGILVSETQEFTLSGWVIDHAGILKTRFRATNAQGDYIVVEDQSTEHMQKFHYAMYQDDVLTQSHSLRLMIESEQVMAMVEYEDATNRISYRFQKENVAGEGERIRIRYSCGNLEGTVEEESGDITVQIAQNPETQEYEYRYAVRSNHGGQSSDHEFSGNRHGNSGNHGHNDDSGNGKPGNGNSPRSCT